MTPRTLRRRFLLLTALRWLPTGCLIPATAVFMQARGLTLAELGLVLAVQGVVVVVLEVPSGAFADALGHRRALVLAAAIDVASLALLVAAHDLAAFAVAWALQGVYRALDSGPLEAWFVDAALAADPDADIERGLAGSSVAVGAGISVGAVTTALVAVLASGDAADVLAIPIATAIGLRVVDLVLLRVLVDPGHAAPVRAAAALRATPALVRRSIDTVRASRALTALVLIEVLWGAGMIPVELFAGPRLVEVVGDPERAVATLGVMASLAWAVQAAGAAGTSRLTHWLGSPSRAGAALRLVQGGFVVLGGVIAGVGGLAAAYFGFYLVHGAANAIHYGLVHRATPTGERATMISLSSLASRLGGIVSGIALGALATGAGIPAAFVAAGVLLAAAAPLYRWTTGDLTPPASPTAPAAGRARSPAAT